MRILIGLISTLLIVGIFWFATGPSRKPATFSTEISLGNIKDFKKSVIETLEIRKVSESEFSISLLFAPEICQEYQKFSLILQADGIALSGEPVQIELEKSCLDLNPETGEMIWLVNSDQRHPLIDTAIQNWHIKGLIIQSSQKPEIRISGYEFISVLGNPPEVQF